MDEKKDIARYNEQGDYIFSLDIGTRTVVGIIGGYTDEVFRLADCVVEPHTKRAMVDGQVEDIKQVAKIVNRVKEQLEERNSIKLTKVAIAAAGRALKTKQLTADFDVSDKDSITPEMIKSMEVEAIQKAQAELDEEYKDKKIMFYCVGHSVVQYKLDDYKIISLEGHKGVTASVELIAAFLPSVVVEGLYAVMDLCGLEVVSLTLEPIAAMNAIIPPEIRLINIALVDIGAGTSDIAIARDGSIVAYAMATTAGDELTEVIIKTYLVDFATAEKMKQSCGTGLEEIEYKDIFGLTHSIKTVDFYEKLLPAIELLSDTICKAITEVNGGSPAAVFLIGGGSLVGGLQKLVSQKLGIDEMRVAIGSQEFLKNVDTNGLKMGAEFVTPIGIGITQTLNQGYDFSVITLNDKKVRVFDTKQLSVYELLTMSGYKPENIMGRSGRSLTYSLNGRRVTVKGGSFTPALVTVNGRPAPLSEKVTQGDYVGVTPATVGDNAKVTLGEAIGADRYGKGYVTFCGKRVPFGMVITVNGRVETEDYSIQPLDEVETSGIFTIEGLMIENDVELDGVEFDVSGKKCGVDYILRDGDIITYKAEYEREIDEREEEIIAQTAAVTQETVAEAEETHEPEEPEEPVASEKKPEEIKSPFPQEVWGDIDVTLNSRIITLPATPSKTPHVFLELLNFIDMEQGHREGSNYILLLNGKIANFNDRVAAGDIAFIKWTNT